MERASDLSSAPTHPCWFPLLLEEMILSALDGLATLREGSHPEITGSSWTRIRPTGLMSSGHRHFGVTLPTLFFFLQVVLAILRPLHFRMSFRISKIH